MMKKDVVILDCDLYSSNIEHKTHGFFMLQNTYDLNEKKAEVIDYQFAIIKSIREHLEENLIKKDILNKKIEESNANFEITLNRMIKERGFEKGCSKREAEIFCCDFIDEISPTDNLIKASSYSAKYSCLSQEPWIKDYLPVQKLNFDFFDDFCANFQNNNKPCRKTEILKEYSSENTRLAHAGDLIYWDAWRGGSGLKLYNPIQKEDVINFIIQHAEGLESSLDKKLVEQGYKQNLGPHRLSTIKRRVASLSVFLSIRNWTNPCDDKEVRMLLQKLTKIYGTSKASGKAITRDILFDMIATCGDKTIDIRDKALLLFAWASGGRRREEVTMADIKDLQMTSEGDFIYNLPKSKTDQEAKGYPVPIKGKGAQALKDWLRVSEVNEGPIFRSISKSGAIRGGLSPIDVHRIVRRRLKIAGYDEKQFGAHSLRSGFVTEGGRQGKSLGDIMAMTGHKSVNTAMRYYQAGAIINNSASNLAD